MHKVKLQTFQHNDIDFYMIILNNWIVFIAQKWSIAEFGIEYNVSIHFNHGSDV